MFPHSHRPPQLSAPTKVCFIDGKSSSPLSKMSGHPWKYITERKRSTTASTLTINLRLRGPCRICGRGGEKKLVLTDEKGTWHKRTLHLKWAPVNTGGGRLRGTSLKGRGRRWAADMQRDGSKQLSHTAQSPSLKLSTRHWESTV